jgi:hypothetical protein
MPYAFSQDMTINKDLYTKISDGVGDEVPKGLIVHLAFETSTGMRYVDVWENEADFDRFEEQRLRPVVDKMLQSAGVSRESLGAPQVEDLKIIEIFGENIKKRKLT